MANTRTSEISQPDSSQPAFEVMVSHMEGLCEYTGKLAERAAEIERRLLKVGDGAENDEGFGNTASYDFFTKMRHFQRWAHNNLEKLSLVLSRLEQELIGVNELSEPEPDEKPSFRSRAIDTN